MAALLRTLIFTIIAPGFWTVLVPYWVVGREARFEWRGVALAGWALVVAGTALCGICAFWGFAWRGRGTPAPIDPPKKLVVEGPYRIVRNPMYWGVALVMMGEALAFHAPALAAIGCGFLAFSALFVLVFEEPMLRSKFGAEYEDYCRRVPRWFPRVGSKLD